VSCTASPSLAQPADPTPCSEPTVFENYVHDIYIDNTHVELSLWDTAGQEEFDRLRSLSYDDTHAIMLCFSVDSPDSLENVETKWVSEIAENCPGVKLVLVALKCDLRKKDDDDEGTQPEKALIQYDEGLKVAERIKALRYLGMSRKETSQFRANLHDRVLRHEEQRCK
jgi:Rho family protein